ncbi:type II toxin-antitoxin system Phd/YefM family antitoxin [Salinarimonas ramus]|uniref:Antitoxin n=1 Tax=Salinarimonas ramus TaxID=690164 RepID=A0A917Q6T1_9HYPH|nr:type II toxin-antitoxin system prevent-host-death family antitoxin [Salinarimonas ramus]GGK29233.1 antitoxin [Salinarimonas ramus]
MKTVDIKELDAALRLAVEAAASGEHVVITRDGRPLAKLSPLEEAPVKREERIGFLRGRANIPDDFDTAVQDEIAELFEGR